MSASPSWHNDDGMPDVRQLLACGWTREQVIDHAEQAWSVFCQTEPQGFRFYRDMLDQAAIRSWERH